MLEFLNQNSGAFAVIFSAVVAFATVVYAILTSKLVSETRKMREVQTEPKISATIQPKEEWLNFIDLVIQNIGLGPAYNVKFEVIPDFEDRGHRLSDLGFVKNGLRYLAPDQKIRFFLTSLAENFEEKVKKPFEIKITYQSSSDKTYKDVYLIDFSQQIGLTQLGEPPLYEIAKNIENIQKDINRLSTGSQKLKVIRYTKEDIEEEERKRFERMSQ